MDQARAISEPEECGPDVAPGAQLGLVAHPAWTLRRGLQNMFWIYVTGLVFLGFAASDLLRGDFGQRATLIGTIQLIVVAIAYVFAAWMSDASLPARWAYVGGFAVLLISLSVVWGWDFVNQGVYLAILLATLIPWRFARIAIPVLGALVASASLATGTWTAVLIGVMALGVGMATGGGIQSGRTAHRLAQAEQRVSVLAVAAERERIGRDLHDILGHSLTAISIKTGLAARLVDADPEAAKQQLSEVSEIARQALADVRSTASGFRQVRVAGEIASAGSVLIAAGITPAVPTAVEAMPDEVSELFGYVVREAVTNVIRHSEATRCVITVDRLRVSVSDDGRGFATGQRRSGLLGLAERVRAAGGVLDVHSEPGGGTTVTASLVGASEQSTPLAVARS